MPLITAPDIALNGRQPLQPRHLASDLSNVPERIRLRNTPNYSTLRKSRRDALAPLQALQSLHEETLARRQQGLHAGQVFAIPASYKGLNAGPTPGVVVGVVLGTVLGFLLVIWLVFVLINNTPTNTYIEGDEVDINITRHSGTRTHRTRTHRSTHRTARSEMSEHQSQAAASSHHNRQPSRSPQPPPQRTERIIVEETRRRTERSQPPPARSASSAHQTERISVRETETERRVAGDDVVEVIEEHSEVTPEQPRKKSGYRPVDPNEYAGGNYPQTSMNRSRSKR